MSMINLILDTDMGPDCDDAGALACAHGLMDDGLCRLLAVTHCTSNPFGPGCIDAIDRWYGRGDIPVGTLKAEGFLDEPQYCRYNEHVARHYPNRYPDGQGVTDATAVLRETLAAARDGSVVLCAIGPLTNVSRLLQSGADAHSALDGAALVARKVLRLVVMGGGWKEPEWNFQMDPAAAADVCANWPTPIWFSTFDVGAGIVTGARWEEPEGCNPVCDAYRLYTQGQGRMSWDLTAVWVAVAGAEPWFSLSDPGRFCVDATGASVWQADAQGNHRYLIQQATPAQIAAGLDACMRRGPKGGTRCQ